MVAAGERLQGLTDAEAEARRSQYGENILPAPKGPTVWSILLAQFKSPLVYIILAAAVLSLLLGERTDFVIIMVVVVADVALGFIQEYQAERTYSSLKALIQPTAHVVRGGRRQEVPVRDLVPGDVVLLALGDRIPADGTLLDAARLAVDEAILTGESEPVRKGEGPAQALVYMGTTVVSGRGIMQVTHIGTSTELGHIAATLREGHEEETPLQIRLRAFSRTLTWLVAGVTAAILIIGVATGRPFLDMLRIAVILAIAAVPEGLLIAVTVALAAAMRKILQRNGLVKRLLAVETLGSVTVICTDKTGTLTEGRMRVTRADLTDRLRALQAMVLCNDLEGPLELALWDYARQTMGELATELAAKAERLAEEPFSSETKFMITAMRIDGEETDYLKGAPELVLGMCHIPKQEQQRVLALAEEWGSEGLKLLGLAWRPLAPLGDHSGYTWAGLVALEDPVRAGVPQAIGVARRAGIQIKMITGDYRRTAEKVARSIGLPATASQVIDGAELSTLSDEALRQRVRDTVVFARIRADDKLRIVRALQAQGEITAMIGDGVNDAPALNRANIGVVVGTASDLAKETADLILLDSNLRTIVAAVEEGRVVFENIRKLVSYALSNSFDEVLLIFVTLLLGLPTPLTVAQILWIHLICDGPADIVLGFEPRESGIMLEPPRPLQARVLPTVGLALIGVISGASALYALALFSHAWLRFGDLALAQTLAFAWFAVNSMVYIFAYRSLRRSLLRSGRLARNKPLIGSVALGLGLAIGAVVIRPLRNALGLVPLTPLQWATIFGAALVLLLIVEVAKYLDARSKRKPL